MPELLVSAAEVATFLNQSEAALGGAARIEQSIELAGDLIRSEIQQLLDYQADDVAELYGDGTGVLLLPELPVDDVTLVEETLYGSTDALIEDEDFSLELGDNGRLGIIRRLPRRAGIWPLGSKIAVTYSHGYDVGTSSGSPADQPLPGAIKLALFRVLARGLSNPTGKRQETIGRYGYTSGGSDAGLYLTAGDLRDLEPFRPGNRGGSK